MFLTIYNKKTKKTDTVNKKILLSLKHWFTEYVKGFYSEDADFQRNIDMKVEHTRRVCQEIIDIGRSLNLSQKELFLAEAIALLHDVGRFEQYAHYQTFVDYYSEDHAELGVKIIKNNSVLINFNESMRDLIIRTILYHNRAELPKNETERCLFFSKLLRDADKLDILRVVTNYYQENNGKRNEALELNLPDLPGISDNIYADLLAERIAEAKDLKTLNDFKLFQMGWIYDVNFTRTFQLIRERLYLEKIQNSLPKTERVLRVYSKINTFLKRKCYDKC